MQLNQFLQVIEKELARRNISPEKSSDQLYPTHVRMLKTQKRKREQCPLGRSLKFLHWAGPRTAKFCKGKQSTVLDYPSEFYCFKNWISSVASMNNRHPQLLTFWVQEKPPTRNQCCLITFKSFNQGLPTSQLTCLDAVHPLLWHAISSADLRPCHLSMSATTTSELH